METQKPLLKDEDGEKWDGHIYQVNPKVLHLYAVKRIFRYKAYTDSDYAGASLDRKSTTGGKAKKSVKLMMEKLFRMELELMLTQQPRKPKRKDTPVPQPSDPIENVIDEAVHKELGDSLVRDATTASSLEAEQDSGNINKTQSKATPNESSSQGTNSGGGPRVLDLEKTETTQDNEIASLKRRVKKLKKKIRSRTHRLKRLYKVGLTARVESSDNEESLGEDASKQGRIDAIDADEEITLIYVQNVDEEVFDVNVLDGEEVFVAEQEVVANKENEDPRKDSECKDQEKEDNVNSTNNVNTADNVNTVSSTLSAATITTITIVDDIILAQALEEMKNIKPRKKGVVIQEPGESTTIISSQQLQGKSQSHDKGKRILIEEPVKPANKKDLIRLDEEVALKLQAEFDEEERLAREKAKKKKKPILP
ncbi:hypothetical protein Tco_0210785 [Tanacetum coccineum]